MNSLIKTILLPQELKDKLINIADKKGYTAKDLLVFILREKLF